MSEDVKFPPATPRTHWSVPEFSPPREEKVLHSIFSPNFAKDKTGREENVKRTTSPAAKSRTGLVGVDGNEIILSLSPTPQSTRSPVSGITDTTGSPQRPSASSHCLVDTSFQSLETLDMLNKNFIDGCKPDEHLRKIVDVLSEQNDSRHLLQLARKKLVDMEFHSKPVTFSAARQDETPGRNLVDASPGKQVLANSTLNISRISTGNTSLDDIDPSKSSLNFSLSPSSAALHGVELVETPSMQDGAFFGSSMELNSFRLKLRPIAEGSSSGGKSHEDSASSTLRDKDSRRAMENSFVRKLHELERAKDDAESLIQSLEGRVATAHAEKRALEAAVNKLEQETTETREVLENERRILRKKDIETKLIEERLQLRIQELQSNLSNEKERSRLVVGAERSLRNQRETEVKSQKQRNQELHKQLCETRDSLENLKQRHAFFRLELLRATGTNTKELSKLSRQDFIAELAKKMKSLRDENDKLALEVREMREEPSSIVAEKERIDQRLSETLQLNMDLEKENLKLHERITELSREVASSRTYIDKLLKTTHETQENNWEKRESQYKSVINSLRQQIRKQATSVSVELYKAAVDDGKQTQQELQSARDKLKCLQSELSILQKNSKQGVAIHALPNMASQLSRPNTILPPSLAREKGTSCDAAADSLHAANARQPKENRTLSTSSNLGQKAKVDRMKSSPKELAGCCSKPIPKGKSRADELVGMVVSFQLPTPHTNATTSTPRTIPYASSPVSPLADADDVLAWVDSYARNHKTEIRELGKQRCKRDGASPGVEKVKVRSAKEQQAKRADFRRRMQYVIDGKNSSTGIALQTAKSAFSANDTTLPKLQSRNNASISKENIQPAISLNILTWETPSRRKTVERFGGRKGLQQKLKQMRSPPPLQVRRVL